MHCNRCAVKTPTPATRRVAWCLLFLWTALLAGGLQAATAAETVDFRRPDLNGRMHALSDHRGRFVVVNFWATWCGPCVREIPMLRTLHAERDDVVVVGVNFEQIDDASLRAFLDEFEVSYPVVRAGGEPLLPFEPLLGLPTTFVVDPDGRLLARRTGEVTRDFIDDVLADHGRSGY